MKSLNLLLAGIGLLVMSGQAYSQNDQSNGQRKPLNNPMYSTNNYKHPNLAAAARKWDNKEGVEVKKPSPADAQLANYKAQTPASQPAGGVTIDHTPSASLADRNYKIQRPSEPRPAETVEGYYVKKQQPRRQDETVIGQ